jgi:hypothetical protein
MTFLAGSQARKREDVRVARSDPLALDPYSPMFPPRAPQGNGADPLGLDPYSPTLTAWPQLWPTRRR